MIHGFNATLTIIGHSDQPEHSVPHADRDALFKLFEESPGDLTAYGAMADIMDETGYANIAHAYRWMSRRGKWPHKREHYTGRNNSRIVRKVPDEFRWAWYRGDGPNGRVSPAPVEANILPAIIMEAPQKVYGSHAAAVMALAGWLARLKDAYDLEPAKRGQ